MKKFFVIVSLLIGANLYAFETGDTLNFTIGNTQIQAVIEEIAGDTLVLDGIIRNMNFGSLYVDGLKLSLDAFAAGSLVVYDYGSIYLQGTEPVVIGGVTLSNLELYLDETGFWAYGDIDFQGTLIRMKFTMNADGFVRGSAYLPEVIIGGVTIRDLTLTLDEAGISGYGYFDFAGNSLYVKVLCDTSGVYGYIEKCNITVGSVQIIDFSAYLSSDGFKGKGKIQIYENYLVFSFSISDNYAINVYDGLVTVHNITIKDIEGQITETSFSLSGTVSLYETLLHVAFSVAGDSSILLTITDSYVTVGNVEITELNLTFDSLNGISGSGKVHISNLSYPVDGYVAVKFTTDLSGQIAIGISDGYVVLDSGEEITNLNGYLDNNGFWGCGTYTGDNGDVTVHFRSDTTGEIFWSISGSSIVIGDIVLHHYYIDVDGNAHGWWIISPEDSIYFDISADGKSATVHSPCSFDFGGVMVYNFTGTITTDPEVSFTGSGFVLLGNEDFSISVPIYFSTNSEGKLVGYLPENLTVYDGYGVTINVYGITVTITEDGIQGYGHLSLEGVEATVEFYAYQGGFVNATIKDGFIELGYLYLKNFNMTLIPFYATGDILIPDINGGVSFVLRGDGQGGVALTIPGFSFEVDGFQVSGSMDYCDGKLIFSGSVTIPGGATGSIDYLSLTSEGIDSCEISLANVTISGFTLVSAHGVFARDPDRIILSGTFDLSQSGIVETVYFENLVVSPGGEILSCQSVGVENLNIAGFILSGYLELTSEYIIIHNATADMSSIDLGTIIVLELVFTRTGEFVSVSAFGIENVNVGIFHGWGWAYFIPEGVRIDGRVDLDNIGFFYAKGLVINSDGEIVSLIDGAANVQIGDYGFYGRVTLPAENRIYIEGEIKLPEFISGTAGGSILLERTEDGEGILGLGYNVLAGSFEIPSFDIAGYEFSSGSFEFDSLGVQGEAEVNVPNIAGFYLTFFIEWDGTFHYAEITTEGLNIPLGETGLVLTGAGGGLYYFEDQDVWEILLTGTVEDMTQTLELIATLEVYTDGRISGVGHLAVEGYVYGSAGFEIDIPACEITASAWIGEDPDEGISYWGCYIKGETTVWYYWNTTEAKGLGNVDIEVWFIHLGADMGFAYNTTYPYIYGIYWKERLYSDGIGAAGILGDYLYGINVQWNGSGFDFDVWSGSSLDSIGTAPFVHDFLIAGPYPDAGIDFDYLGGEDKIRPYDSYESTGGRVWFGAQTDTTGFINLTQYFPDATEGVAYINLFIYYADSDTVYMRYGIAGEYKILFNGEVIAANSSIYAEPDKEVFIPKLKAGWNQLLVKIRKVSDIWGMYLRFTDENGNEIPFLTTQPDDPQHVVEFHDRCYTLNPDRWDWEGYVFVENGALALESRGTTLYSTLLKDKKYYPREDFPSVKCEFMLTGTALNDSTIVGVEGYTPEGEYRFFGILFYYPGKASGPVAKPFGGSGETKKATDTKDIYINQWYTLEFVFEPEVINCYLYKAGEEGPLKPLYVDSTYDWNPSFFATVGGDDNKLYLDNIVVKKDWLTDYNVTIESPHPYPNDTIIEWVIEKDGASALRFHFSEFSLETGFDSLIIKDENGVVWAAYTGNLGRFTSCMIPGKKAYIILKTDVSGYDYGFTIDFIQYYIDYPYFYSTATSITTEHPYPNNDFRTWGISIPSAKSIKLYFSDFSLEEGHDFVYLYDANDILYATYTGKLGNFASVAIPGNYVKIVFTSDDVIQDYGFNLKRVTYATTDWTGIEEGEEGVVVGDNMFMLKKNIVTDNLEFSVNLVDELAPDIKIYDITGRKVEEFSPGVLKPGIHTFRLGFNTKPAGIYFIQTKLGERIETRKIIKVR